MTLFDFGLDIVTEDEKALASKQASKHTGIGVVFRV